MSSTSEKATNSDLVGNIIAAMSAAQGALSPPKDTEESHRAVFTDPSNGNRSETAVSKNANIASTKGKEHESASCSKNTQRKA